MLLFGLEVAGCWGWCCGWGWGWGLGVGTSCNYRKLESYFHPLSYNKKNIIIKGKIENLK